jgi:hypothetical protein
MPALLFFRFFIPHNPDSDWISYFLYQDGLIAIECAALAYDNSTSYDLLAYPFILFVPFFVIFFSYQFFLFFIPHKPDSDWIAYFLYQDGMIAIGY